MVEAQSPGIAKEEHDGILHVFDLPQLYQKPSAEALQRALNLLAVEASPFDSTARSSIQISPEGIPEYLTRIVGSSLTWLESESDQEVIWELASKRLAERSGRTGMGSFDRTFSVPLSDEDSNDVKLKIHEPALTEDNLGHKTWGSSFAVAKHLHQLRDFINPVLRVHGRQLCDCTSSVAYHNHARVLELGAGTGVLGLAFAAVFQTHVMLTDLSEISRNLARNAETNSWTLDRLNGGRASVAVLDWTRPDELTQLYDSEIKLIHDEGIKADQRSHCNQHYDMILAADPVYSLRHPQLLTDAIQSRLSSTESSRVLIAYPLRKAYQLQIEELDQLLKTKCSLIILVEGRLQGSDDWQVDDEVTVEYKIMGHP